MQRHPFKRDLITRTVTVAVLLTVTALLWFLISFYTQNDVFISLLVTLLYIIPLSVILFYYWYINSFLKTIVTKIAVATLANMAAYTASYALCSMLCRNSGNLFHMKATPLLIISGVSFWIIVVQWYSSFLCKTDNGATDENDESTPEQENNNVDTIKHISVKDGSRIHIIKLEDIFYIQAYGDYVMIFTDKGKFIKEQTMKYFQINLPDMFVRIHRSCIVNTHRIVRAELFGKESYSIHLSNNITLRASAAGYKLLKDKLML